MANPAFSTSGRRPLKVRGARWAAALARWLGKHGWRPNAISVLSVGFAAVAGGLLIVAGQWESTIGRGICLGGAAVAIQLRLLCNLLDGMVAIEGGFATKSGEIFNELPDRFSDLFILAGAGYFRSDSLLSLQLGWAATAVALLTAYVRALGASAGAGQQFVGPMAKPQRMAVMTGACLIEAVPAVSGSPGMILMTALVLIIVGGLWTTARRTVRICRALEAA